MVCFKNNLLTAQLLYPSHGFHDARLIFQERLVEKLRGSGIKLPGMPDK